MNSQRQPGTPPALMLSRPAARGPEMIAASWLPKKTQLYGFESLLCCCLS